MKKNILTLVVPVALLTLLFAAIGAAPAKSADWDYSFCSDSPDEPDCQPQIPECSGGHCSFSRPFYFFNDSPVPGTRSIINTLYASVNIDLALQTPITVKPTKNLSDGKIDCSGDKTTIKVPISSTGEVSGWLTGWFDSPPVQFLANNVWYGSTDGLTCQSDVPSYFCMKDTGLYGTWLDKWQSSASNVTCKTVSPSIGQCEITGAKNGTVGITLNRTVSDIYWLEKVDLQYIHNPQQFAEKFSEGPVEGQWPMQATINFQCASEQPHLSVVEASHSPLPVISGNSVSFQGKIKNLGSAKSAAFKPVLYLDVNADDGGVSWDKTLAVASAIPGLDPDQSTIVNWAGAWTAIFGTHIYKICPDSTGEGCLTKNMIVEAPSTAPEIEVRDVTETVAGSVLENNKLLDFNKVRVGSVKSKTIKITNLGTGNLEINNIRLLGGDAAFSVSNAQSQTLQVNQSSTFTVNLAPLEPNTNLSNSVMISNNDADEGTMIIRFNAKAVASPSVDLKFGNTRATASDGPVSLLRGQGGNIYWETDNVLPTELANCSVTGGWQYPGTETGQINIASITENTTFGLSCRTSEGVASDNVPVIIYNQSQNSYIREL